jgi:mannose-1-phosphate guanylyltransferase
MQSEAKTWALVLAAGEGTRLRSLTTTPSGAAIPKQYCSLRNGPSLLEEALQRARAVASNAHTCVVVAKQHRRWSEPQLQSLPIENRIEQPENRGTANGILLPLLHILERDPGAEVVLFPSDQHVREEAVLARALREAVAQLRRRSDEIVLLGLTPEEADPELGYIVPGEADTQGAWEVLQFVEKPTVSRARELIARGGLLNSFIMASAGCWRCFGVVFPRSSRPCAALCVATLRRAQSRERPHVSTLSFRPSIFHATSCPGRKLICVCCGCRNVDGAI